MSISTKGIAMKARLIALAALLTAVGTIATSPASASITTDAELMCTDLIGFRFELPAYGTARQSLFYFRVDGGSWQTTNWYFTSGYTTMMYRPYVGWQSIGVGGGFLPVYQFSDSATHTVDGYEYRYVNGVGTWHNLGSCQTSTYHWGEGGIVLR